MAFRGVFTAIVTPFEKGQIDLPSLTRLVEAQVRSGVSGIVACGTTGESATLSDDEILRVTRHVIEVSQGACKVIAGVGSNSTQHTVELMRKAIDLGIDGALVITPYYNKPSQSGLEAHFSAVSRAAKDTPLMLYTVPGRTGVHLGLETFARLSRLDNVVSLKDATADLALSAEYIGVANGQVGIMSGDDITALPLWSIGGEGVVSVAANVYPSTMVKLWNSYQEKDLARAQALHHRLIPLFRALFLESNPSPVKHLMARQGLIETPELRLPLVAVSDSTSQRLHKSVEGLASLEIESRA